MLAAHDPADWLAAESVALCVINAVVVALASMGAYEATFNRDQ